ncbi:ester cyclase [Streptomyces sp. NPDC053048]|uniref:ester cyclase n=1 Tax=Streptomyces sp. NPDC053048 TaxID=3365694 RepID=UPI0037D0CDB7
MNASPSPLSHQQLWDAWSRLWNGDYAIADDIVSRTMRVNIPRHGMPGAETLTDGPQIAAWIAAFRSSFDDNAAITGELGPFIVGDYAIGRWVFRGTWQGGRPATATAPPGTEVTFRGVDILRFEDGRVAEYWLSDDQLDLYAQLGALGATHDAATGGEGPNEGPQGALRLQLAELPADAGRKLLLERVLELAAEATESTDLLAASGDESFLTLGVDSLAAVALSDLIGELTGLTLPSTMVFDQPTPRALADHLWTSLSAGTAASDGPDGASVSVRGALSRLEEATAEVTSSEGDEADGELRTELVQRLTTMLDLLTAVPGAPAAGKPLDAASPDELFAYLDTRLRPLDTDGRP